MMDRLSGLFRLYYNKTASRKEREEFMALLTDASPVDLAVLADLIRESGENLDNIESGLQAEKAALVLATILGKPTTPDQQAGVELHSTEAHPRIRSIRFRKSRWWAAAAAILVFAVGGYFMLTPRSNKGAEVVAEKSQDVNPGCYKAKLKLADGTEIILDSASHGELALQGGTVVLNKDGELVYKASPTPPKEGGQAVYNTISTAKGETYSMTLADGSKVWLNSGSSIYFPVSFPGNERRIEITGEVYVKVAKNRTQPFIATANGMEVLALGTEFNINAYTDEDNMSATLIEGSVKVARPLSDDRSISGTSELGVTLKPGQQTQLKGGKLSAARQANVDEIIAWKDGFFHFESADLKTVLRQFARWYDIEVVYEGKVTQDRFFVIVNRSSTLASVLKALQTGGVKFMIEGKKLIVKSL